MTDTNTTAATPTLGQSRVRAAFNPSGNATIDQIKKAAADFIDLCESLKEAEKRSEKNRCLTLAQTDIEAAAMWAVKGATAPAPAADATDKTTGTAKDENAQPKVGDACKTNEGEDGTWTDDGTGKLVCTVAA